MADQNNSGKKGMNTFADDIDRSDVLSELERIGARSSRKSINRIALDDKMRSSGSKLNALYDEAERRPELTSHPAYMEGVPALRDEIRGTRRKMNASDNAAISRAESEASTYVTKQFSGTAINSQVGAMQRDSSVQNSAFGMANKSYDELQSRREEIHSEIRVRERGVQHEVKGMFTGRGQVDPEKSAAVNVMMGGTKDQVRELAMINAASAIQRQTGNDPNSKLKNLTEMGQQANKILDSEAIGKEVQSGGINISSGGKGATIANADVNKEVVNQARILADALAKLSSGAVTAEEDLGKLRSTADEAAENMKKLQDGQKAGAGNGGGNGANIAMGVAGGFNAIGGAAQQIMINQRMQQIGNTSGFAGMANQQYDMYSKARGGDIASQLALGQFGESDKFGTEMKRATNVVQGAGLIAAGAQATAGVIQATEAAGQKANPLAYASGASTNNTQALISGTLAATQGVANAAVITSDITKNTSAQGNRLAGAQADMQARIAINHVGATQAQGLRNFMTDMDVAGQEMGGRASAYLESSTSDANLSKMAEARMSPEQFAKMSQQGASQMGSQFNSDQIYGARNLERGGFGSMQTNMGRMAQLAGAGSNNPQAGMESVLAAAMTKGLDSSKAISDMVSNTAAMVSVSSGAQVGIDTTGAASTMLAAQIDPNIANKEFAANRAATAQQIATGLTTNDSMSFSGMVNTARISKNTGLGGTDSIMAQKLDTATLRSMMDMTEEDRDKALLNKGVDSKNSKMKTSKDLVQSLLDADQREILEGGGAAFGVGMDVNKVQDKMKRGEKLDRNETKLVAQSAIGAGFSGGDELTNSMKAVSATNSKAGVDGASTAISGGGPNDIKKQMDELRTSGFKQLSEAAGTASTQLKDFGGALKVFTDLTQKYEKGGMGNEKEFSTAASNFAKDFTISTGKFDGSVSRFEEAVKVLSDKAGLKSNANPIMPVMDSKDQRKGANPKGH